MDTSGYMNAVVEQTKTFADWVHGRDAAAPVPTTPKWTLADLVDHVGSTQRVVAMLVGERMTEPSRAFASNVPGPTDSAQWRAWLTESAAEAKQAFESVADDTPVWDPSGGRRRRAVLVTSAVRRGLRASRGRGCGARHTVRVGAGACRCGHRGLAGHDDFARLLGEQAGLRRCDARQRLLRWNCTAIGHCSTTGSNT
jgi:hypothetical protein